jgi:AmmeMemoRadiSam system protein B
MTNHSSDVRPSPLTGTWYPANAESLTTLIDTYLQKADPTAPQGKIVGIFAPHAGLRYSGPVAAYAFKLLQGAAIDTVAVVCPYHRPPAHLFTASVVTSGHDAYETPLGTVAVDADAIRALGERIPLEMIREDQEHALEIELPFLQRVLQPGFKLLPIMLIEQSSRLTKQLGYAIAEILAGRDTLLIASSDLSHFFPQDIAYQLDKATLDSIHAYNPQKVLSTGRAPGEGACGRGALASVMWAAQALGANRADILHYATSGDTGGDHRQVVGYGAGVFYESSQQAN